MFRSNHAYAFGYRSNIDTQSETKLTAEAKKDKRAYQHVDLWKRKELIDCVKKREETMKDCAKRLGINYSTAKHILKVYRRTGSIETDLMKKRKEKNMKLQQKLSKQAEINPLTRPVIINSKYSGFTPYKRNTPNVELTTLQPGECSPASTDYTSA